MRFSAGPQVFGEVKVTVMGNGSLNAALAAHGEADVPGMVLLVERRKHPGGWHATWDCGHAQEKPARGNDNRSGV